MCSITWRRLSVLASLAVLLCDVLSGGVVWGQCEIDTLLASDGEPGDFFGVSVSLSGDFAVVGRATPATRSLS